MNVFISWSGAKSRAVAFVVKDWLTSVIQNAKPWMSVDDIDRGEQWFQRIASQLNESTLGIICLTQSNKAKPWILYETGAVAKGSGSNRVFTLLIDLRPADIVDSPLTQYNHTTLGKEQMWQLTKSINNRFEEPVPDLILSKAFKLSWSKYDKAFKKAIVDNSAEDEAAAEPSDREMLREALATIRALSAQTAAAQAIPRATDPPQSPVPQLGISDLVLSLLEDLNEEDKQLISYMTLDQIQMMASWTRRLAEDKRDLDARIGLDFLKRKVIEIRDRIQSGERNVPQSPFQGPD